jgi:hypothetical protein
MCVIIKVFGVFVNLTQTKNILISWYDTIQRDAEESGVLYKKSYQESIAP